MSERKPSTIEYITVNEIATVLGVTAQTARKIIREQKWPVVRLGMGNGGGIHVRKDAFTRWVHSRETRY